jgi:hypothetical protein
MPRLRALMNSTASFLRIARRRPNSRERTPETLGAGLPQASASAYWPAFPSASKTSFSLVACSQPVAPSPTPVRMAIGFSLELFVGNVADCFDFKSTAHRRTTGLQSRAGGQRFRRAEIRAVDSVEDRRITLIR